jgi:hypothetical protein
MAVGESMLAILAIPAKHGVGLIEGRKMIALANQSGNTAVNFRMTRY